MPSPVGALTKIKKMFSPLEKAVAAHKLESMPSAQWQAYIKANAPKSAKKEALAVKLDELLARQPKVTKAEIVQHIKDNSPKIKTKLLKDKPYTAGDIDSHVNIEPNGSGGYRYIDDNGDVVHESWGTDAMVDYLNSTEGAKYGEHVLPGGQNYQEMLLSLPRNQSQAIIRNQKVYEIKDANGQLLATGQLPMSPRTQAKLNNNPDWVVREFEQPNPNDLRRDPANFQSGHYDDPNILAHMRMNDRPTAEGKKALFLEELQSDWAQKGRKEGFLTPDLHIERRAEIKAEMDALGKEATAMRERGESTVDIRQRMSQLDDALRDIPTPKGIPRAPYVEDTGDWTGLGLKKAIEHAVEQGHDSIAWTTGAQQADRYSLSKQIDRIDHNLNDDGTYSFSAIKNGQEVISKENLTHDELADHLGKDVAEKIVKGEGTAPASVDRWEAEPSIYGEAEAPPPYRSLSGLDLEVGGEGMRGYYDQIVPQTANDILKSMGVTERVKPIGIGKELASPHAGTNYEIRDSAGDLWNTHRNAEDAQQYVDQQMSNPAFIEKGLTLSVNPIEPKYRPTSIQQGFDITPEIRDYVLNQGLPAFAGGGIVKAAGKGLRGLAEKYRLAKDAFLKDSHAKDVVYHGTSGKDFSNFKGMTFLTDSPHVASSYSGDFSNSARVLPLYASIKNPLIVEAGGDYGTGIASYSAVRTNKGDTTLSKLFSLPADEEIISSDAISHLAKESGHDGVIFKNLSDIGGGKFDENYSPQSTVYVTFNPNQIKSAVGNKGTFDPNESDILKARGGAVHMAHGGDVDYDELYEFKDYGTRETGEPKDTGALGEIRMPNGRDVMTEYSINVDGREMPSIVEGMHPADVNYIRETGIVPSDAMATAVHSANKREASGQSPFWNRKDTPAFAHGGEVDYDKHYEFIQPAFAHGGEVDYDSMYEFR